MAKSGRKPMSSDEKKRALDDRREIKYYIEGVPIRKVNIISIYVSEANMVKLAKAKKKHNISVSTILCLSSQPCSKCKNEPVIIYHEGEYLSIPRGLFHKSKVSYANVNQPRKKK